MIRKPVFIVGAALPVLVGVGIGILAYSLVVESGGPEPTAEPTSTQVPLADPVQSETPSAEVEELRNDVEEDNAKPRFVGPLGEFEIVPKEAGFSYPCSEISEVTEEQVVSSDLYFPELDNLAAIEEPGPTGPEAGGCDGSVMFIGGERGLAYVSVFRFFDPLPKLPLDAPEDRLLLSDILGHPALVEIPPQELLADCDLFVILRPNGPDQSGIVLSVQGSITCEEAESLAAEFVAAFEAAKGDQLNG